MPRGVPQGTVTFLFTDIKDSTPLWEEAPTDMAEGLRVHDAIVRATIERHGGDGFPTRGDRLRPALSPPPPPAAGPARSHGPPGAAPPGHLLVLVGLPTRGGV